MENGSLFDLINNETMYLTGEIILQVLRDVAQGLRYLHASKPPVLHGKLMKQSSMLSSDHLIAFIGLLTQSFHDGLLTTQVISKLETFLSTTDSGQRLLTLACPKSCLLYTSDAADE